MEKPTVQELGAGHSINQFGSRTSRRAQPGQAASEG